MGSKAKREQETAASKQAWEGSGLGVLGNGTAAYETGSVSPNEITSPLFGLKDLLISFRENMVTLVAPCNLTVSGTTRHYYFSTTQP